MISQRLKSKLLYSVFKKPRSYLRRFTLENSKTPTLTQQALGLLHQSPSKVDPIVDHIGAAINNSIVANHSKRERRKYIGASSIGDECQRKIQYRYLNYPIDPDKEFSARTLRIFELGHLIEDCVAKWLRDAGFDLRTEDANGKQFGFSIADGEIKGHIDGVICGGPVDMSYPLLWESKSANDKKFQSFVRHGVAKANPIYATQVALYQAYMDLTENPALFTVLNKNTSEIYIELIPFDRARAQEASDRAVNILTAAKANDILPRIAQSKDFYLCKFCEYQQTCWGE